jgi:hypothetical protein
MLGKPVTTPMNVIGRLDRPTHAVTTLREDRRNRATVCFHNR